jgi:hypothetical protein
MPTLSPQLFMMIEDAMNAIRVTETEEFVRTFSNKSEFMLSTDKQLGRIYENIQYIGHSGVSMSQTMRYCQYFLYHLDEWTEERYAHLKDCAS